jgi:hypothetical protein
MPLLANLYIATAIVLVLWVVLIVASIHHLQPTPIEAAHAGSFGVPMFGVGCGYEFAVEASATHGVFSEIVFSRGKNLAAITLNGPEEMLSSAMRKSQDDQSSKTQSGDILEGRHSGFSRKLLCSEEAVRSERIGLLAVYGVL